MQAPIPALPLERRIWIIRGQRVMLDEDLADVYGVSTKRLNEQVRRNMGRFPTDFVFQLTKEETASLRSQNATSNSGRGGRRYLPMAFTEHGAVMLASVLKSAIAVQASVLIVRAFNRLREIVATHKELAEELAKLEKHVRGLDSDVRSLFDTIHRLTASSAGPRRQIGFRPRADSESA